ncbi:MAG: hypothetical protein U0401_28190 [Anaerolineae bacterium]
MILLPAQPETGQAVMRALLSGEQGCGRWCAGRNKQSDFEPGTQEVVVGDIQDEAILRQAMQ